MKTIVKSSSNHLTVGQVEKERGIRLGVRKNMKISTYFSKHGLPELGKFVEKVESL